MMVHDCVESLQSQKPSEKLPCCKRNELENKTLRKNWRHIYRSHFYLSFSKSITQYGVVFVTDEIQGLGPNDRSASLVYARLTNQFFKLNFTSLFQKNYLICKAVPSTLSINKLQPRIQTSPTLIYVFSFATKTVHLCLLMQKIVSVFHKFPESVFRQLG